MSKNILAKRLLILLGLLLAACQNDGSVTDPTSLTDEDAETKIQTFEGLYSQTAEMSSFVPCEMDQFPAPGIGYWLIPNDEFSQLHTLENGDLMGDIAGTYGPYDRFVMLVRFEGFLSPPSNVESESGYGPDGLYAREVKVTKAITVEYQWIGSTLDTTLHNPCP